MKLSSITDTGIRFLGNTDKLYSVLDSSIISVSRFAGGIVLTKLSGPEALAQYILLTAIMTFAQSIPSALRLTPMINLATGKTNMERERIFRWTHRQVRQSIIAGILIGALCYPFSVYCGLNPALYFSFVAATLLGLELQFQRAYSQARFKMKRTLVADLAGVALHAATTGIVWALLNSPMIGFWLGLSLSSLLSILIISQGNNPKLARHQSTSNLKKLNQAIEHARSSGKAMLIGSLANSTCSRLAPFILQTVGGLLAVANFGAAWTILGPMRMISGAINGTLRPRLALYSNSGDQEAFNRVLSLTILGTLVIGAIGTVTSFFTGPFLIRTLFDPSLEQASMLLPLAVIYATLDVTTTTQMIALQTNREDGAKLAAKLRIYSATISLTLIYPAIHWMGAIGAFLALLTAELAYLVGAYRVSHQRSSAIAENQCSQKSPTISLDQECAAKT